MHIASIGLEPIAGLRESILGEIHLRKLFVSAAALSAIVINSYAYAEVTVLHVGDKLARADLLKPGIHRYTRYTITPDGHRKSIDVWSREISYELQDGRRVLHIHQQWDEIFPVTVPRSGLILRTGYLPSINTYSEGHV